MECLLARIIHRTTKTRALSKLAKTDRIDASVLARFAQLGHARLREKQPENQMVWTTRAAFAATKFNPTIRVFAERLKKEGGKDLSTQVRLGLYLATSRQPSDTEVRRGVTLIEALQREDRVSADAALQAFVPALMR